MMKSDIAISGGGQTTYELARIGVPTIGICFAENQLLNLETWRKEGFIRYAGWYDDKELLHNVARAIGRLSSNPLRKKISKIGRLLIDGNGVNRVVNELVSIGTLNVSQRKPLKLRLATENDCQDIWKWRNSTQVREWSFNHEKIPFLKHKAWFFDRLFDLNTRLYVAENGTGRKIGVIRFDRINSKRPHINVNVNPKFLSHGIGTALIEEGSSLMFKAFPQTKALVADVIEDNTGSRKAFVKAGYRMVSTGCINGKSTITFAKESGRRPG